MERIAAELQLKLGLTLSPRTHLLPRFGDMPVSDVTRQEIQVYVLISPKRGTRPSPSHPRCAERDPSHGREVGAPPGESCAARRLHQLEDERSHILSAFPEIGRGASSAESRDTTAGTRQKSAAAALRWRTNLDVAG